MKKNLLALSILFSFIVFNSDACDTPPPTITGPPIIELNTSGNNYTLNMSSAYLNTGGGYQETQWSFEGIGIIGYSTLSSASATTINLNTTSPVWSNLPEGKYDLIAKNRFGGTNTCYGCLTNTTHVLEVEFRRPRPDLVIDSFDYPSSLPQISPTTAKLVIRNIGNADAPQSFQVYYEWSITINNITYIENQTTEQLNFGLPTAPSGTMTDLFFPINTPFVRNVAGSPESWTLKLTIDPNDAVKERSNTNNSATYTRTIFIPSSAQSSPTDVNYPTLISVENSFGKNVWKKGEPQIDLSQLKGFHIFKFEENGMIRTQKIVNQ